jgi:hypothetical protein
MCFGTRLMWDLRFRFTRSCDHCWNACAGPSAVLLTNRCFAIRDAKKALVQSCRRLGYVHYSHRALRRCFITRCIELGLDFKTVAAFQGHRDGGVFCAITSTPFHFNHALLAFAFFSGQQDRELLGAISRGLLDCPCRV